MENISPVLKEGLSPSFDLIFQDGILQNIAPGSVFELIRYIKDPEHPYSLERLSVVATEDIFIGCLPANHTSSHATACTKGLPIKTVDVIFTPTVPHCSMAGIIGLCIRRRLESCLPSDYWIRVHVKEGSHTTDKALTKQLNDKDRIMAAFENDELVCILDSCISAGK